MTIRIAKVCDAEGVYHTKKHEVGALFSSFYAKLFTTSSPQCIESCLEPINLCVSLTMNQKLLQPFTKTEIQQIVFSMNSLRAPGSDGFPAQFINIIGQQYTMKSVNLFLM